MMKRSELPWNENELLFIQDEISDCYYWDFGMTEERARDWVWSLSH